MKNLNEYKAEILRRSEERISKRSEKIKRTRKLMLSVVVPLCLVLVISSVLVLPSLVDTYFGSAEKDKVIYDAEDADGATAVETQDQSYIYAELQGYPDRIDEPEKIKELSELIQLAYADSYLDYDITERASVIADEGEDAVENEMYDCVQENVSEDKTERYVIRLIASDGYIKTVVIDGSTIRDPELGMEVTLKEERLRELKAILMTD